MTATTLPLPDRLVEWAVLDDREDAACRRLRADLERLQDPAARLTCAATVLSDARARVQDLRRRQKVATASLVKQLRDQAEADGRSDRGIVSQVAAMLDVPHARISEWCAEVAKLGVDLDDYPLVNLTDVLPELAEQIARRDMAIDVRNRILRAMPIPEGHLVKTAGVAQIGPSRASRIRSQGKKAS